MKIHDECSPIDAQIGRRVGRPHRPLAELEITCWSSVISIRVHLGYRRSGPPIVEAEFPIAQYFAALDWMAGIGLGGRFADRLIGQALEDRKAFQTVELARLKLPSEAKAGDVR